MERPGEFLNRRGRPPGDLSEALPIHRFAGPVSFDSATASADFDLPGQRKFRWGCRLPKHKVKGWAALEVQIRYNLLPNGSSQHSRGRHAEPIRRGWWRLALIAV